MKEPLVSSPSHEAAFAEVFTVHEPAIRAYCLRRLPTWSADDAVADTFLTVWRKRDEAPCGDEQRLWLYGVARNVVRNAKRSAERSRRLTRRLAREPATHQDGPEVIVVRNAEETELLAAIGRLR
jgi:RNA polymerase sigma-70 factor (ECF subfamily)